MRARVPGVRTSFMKASRSIFRTFSSSGPARSCRRLAAGQHIGQFVGHHHVVLGGQALGVEIAQGEGREALPEGPGRVSSTGSGGW